MAPLTWADPTSTTLSLPLMAVWNQPRGLIGRTRGTPTMSDMAPVRLTLLVPSVI